MNEYQGTEGLHEPLAMMRGVQMFKEHVNAMKSGSKLLGGEQGAIEYEENSAQE